MIKSDYNYIVNNHLALATDLNLHFETQKKIKSLMLRLIRAKQFNQLKESKENIMLVLTRKQNESVIICDQDIYGKLIEICEVRVNKVVGNQVALGFSADSKYKIHRTEIFNKINDEVEKNVS